MAKTKQDEASVAHRTTGEHSVNRKWQKAAAALEESTKLKECALMCLAIREETSETLHSALGSSGRFL